MDSNSGNEQTVYYRHQSLSSREPSFLQGFLLDQYNESDNIEDFDIKKYEASKGSSQTENKEKNSDVPRIILHHYIYNLLTPPGVVNKTDDVIDVTQEMQSKTKERSIN